MTSSVSDPSPPTLRTTLHAMHADAVLRTLYDQVCAGGTMIVVALALALGLPAEQCGWIAVLYSVTGVMLAVGAVSAGRFAHPKRAVLALAAIEPILMVVMGVALPWLPPAWALGFAAVALVLAGATMNLNQPMKDEWLSSAVPEGLRARYIARRFQFIAVTIIAAMFLLGPVGTWAGIRAGASAAADPLRLGLIIAVAGVVGALVVVPLARARMPVVSAQTRVEWRDFLDVVRHPPFVRFAAMTLIYNTPFVLAGPYTQVIYQDVTHLSAKEIAAIFIAAYVGKLAALPLAGRWLTPRRAGRCVVWIGPLYALQFMAMALTPEHVVWPLAAAAALSGAAEAFWAVAINIVLYQLVPQDRTRAAYFALWRISLLIHIALGAALAVYLVNRLHGATLDLGWFRIGHFQILYGLCALGIFPCMFSGLLVKQAQA